MPTSEPLLFDLAVRKPTTRQIADLMKQGGTDALPDAQERADHARYQEVICRSALNAVEGMPFRWTLNPYRGCTHGCHYCFARRYQTQLELDAGDEFSTLIFVKTNFVEVLRRELDHPNWSRELAALGTATDPYQPIEGQYRLTRGTLQALTAARTPVGLLTKGPMIVRDIDVLQDVFRVTSGSSVCVSVPTVDEDAWRALEPGTAHPLQRLRAVRTLVDAGVEAGVLMAPLVPGFSTHPAKMEATVKAVADHGAAVALEVDLGVALGQLLQVGRVHRPVELLLRGEDRVDGPGGDARVVRDLLHLRVLVAANGEHPLGRLEDQAAVGVLARFAHALLGMACGGHGKLRFIDSNGKLPFANAPCNRRPP